MPEQSFDVEAYVDATAMLIGLTIDPAHRPGVIVNVERIAQLATLVMEFPLPDEVEAAPVFEP